VINAITLSVRVLLH